MLFAEDVALSEGVTFLDQLEACVKGHDFRNEESVEGIDQAFTETLQVNIFTSIVLSAVLRILCQVLVKPLLECFENFPILQHLDLALLHELLFRCFNVFLPDLDQLSTTFNFLSFKPICASELFVGVRALRLNFLLDLCPHKKDFFFH